MDGDDIPELSAIWDEARQCIESGNRDKAIEIYKYILVRYANEPVAVEYANAYLADLFLTLRKLDLAEDHIKKAINLKPQNPGYRYILGFVYSHRRRWDKSHSKFVIAETKDLSERITPRELAKQKEQFVGEKNGDTKCFLGKLRAQEDWFRNRMVKLKREYGISYDDKVTIEGVVVVNHPMLWLFGHNEQIAVLDDYEFFRRLKGGKGLVYNPHTRHT